MGACGFFHRVYLSVYGDENKTLDRLNTACYIVNIVSEQSDVKIGEFKSLRDKLGGYLLTVSYRHPV